MILKVCSDPGSAIDFSSSTHAWLTTVQMGIQGLIPFLKKASRPAKYSGIQRMYRGNRQLLLAAPRCVRLCREAGSWRKNRPVSISPVSSVLNRSINLLTSYYYVLLISFHFVLVAEIGQTFNPILAWNWNKFTYLQNDYREPGYNIADW